MRCSAPIYPLLLLLPLYVVASVVPEQVRSLLETTHELSNLVIRDAGPGQHTTESHLRKSPNNQMAGPPKYQRLPPHLFCKGRSSIMTSDDDLYNQPSTRGPPAAGQTYGYILCSAIKKPNVSKYLSTYLVRPREGRGHGLTIRTVDHQVKPDNYDSAGSNSYSYHFNSTIPADATGRWTFYILEVYDIFEPTIENLVMSHSFPISID